MLDPPTKRDEADADRGIGHAFEVAGHELVGNAEFGGDGADLVLDEGAIVVGVGRIGNWTSAPDAAE